VPELPELQAHAERLTDDLGGTDLAAFRLLSFHALKTVLPPPEDAVGHPLGTVGRRGKHLLLPFGEVMFVVHLMQGGRLKPDPKQAAKVKGGLARWLFADGRALLLTEMGTEKRAGVWVVPAAEALDRPPLHGLGPEATELDAAGLAARFTVTNMRLHGFLREQHLIAGLGRRLANEVCHRARLSPFAMTAKLGLAGAEAVVQAIGEAVDEGLAYERTRPDMSASADRPGGVHGRAGQACPACGEVIRSVEYASHTVAYCPTCQTGRKVLADNTTSKFLK
jgi:formamidopyrimidine-DNA glycosylase